MEGPTVGGYRGPFLAEALGRYQGGEEPSRAVRN